MVKKNNELWFPPISTYRSYSQCMLDLTADDVLIGLLGYGMFSEQLPPIFSSESFLAYCLINTEKFPNVETAADYVRYEANRHNFQVRLFGIPNPFNYAKLCWHIFDNWKNIQNYFEVNTKAHSYKISRVHVRKLQHTLRIFELTYNKWETDETPETDLRIGAKYVVKADISSCFPSIYTHAIPWAIMGRPISKKNRRCGWVNVLDKLVSNTTDGETHGILIGPHSSNLISELILTKIDMELYNKNFAFVRKIDDYTAYVKDYQQGLDFLIFLRKQLRDYGLRINDQKTVILELPQSYEDDWVNRIKYEMPKPINETINYTQMQQYFDLVKSFIKGSDSALSILKYAIKTLKDLPLSDNAKLLTQKFFLEMASLFPYIIPSLEEYLFNSLHVDVKIIEEWCNASFQTFNEMSNQEAISYLCYFALKYNFKLNDLGVLDITDSTDCVFKTIGSVYIKKNELNEYDAIYTDAKKYYKDDLTKNSYWLYWYTVLEKDNLDGNWKKIKEADISFIV